MNTPARGKEFRNATGCDPDGAPVRPRTIKFSVAANYDPELVPALAAHPVDEVYGKLPRDGISSGRREMVFTRPIPRCPRRAADYLSPK